MKKGTQANIALWTFTPVGTHLPAAAAAEVIFQQPPGDLQTIIKPSEERNSGPGVTTIKTPTIKGR